MSVSYRHSSSLDVASGGPNFLITLPSGSAVGDLLIVAAWTTEQSAGIGAYWQAPAGWTDIVTAGAVTGFGSSNNLPLTGPLAEFWYLGYKVVTAGDVSAGIFTFHVLTGNHALDGSLPCSATMVCYTGFTALLAPLVYAEYGGGGTFSGESIPAITTPEANTLVVDVALQRSSSSLYPVPGVNQTGVVANDDSYSAVNGPVKIPAPGVLANDSLTPHAQNEVAHGHGSSGGTVPTHGFGDLAANTIGVVPARVWNEQAGGGGGRWAYATVLLRGAPIYTPPPPPTQTLAIVTPAAHGSASLFVDGAISYVPDSTFAGTDSFVYQLGNTDDATTANATVTLDVVAPHPIFDETRPFKAGA